MHNLCESCVFDKSEDRERYCFILSKEIEDVYDCKCYIHFESGLSYLLANKAEYEEWKTAYYKE